MSVNVEKVGLGMLIPTLLNPTTAAVLAIGAIGNAVFNFLSDDDESESVVEASSTVPQIEPLPTVASTVELQCVSIDENKDEILATSHQPEPEADHREVIRLAMSELGKRGAAARAKKKADMN